MRESSIRSMLLRLMPEAEAGDASELLLCRLLLAMPLIVVVVDDEIWPDLVELELAAELELELELISVVV